MPPAHLFGTGGRDLESPAHIGFAPCQRLPTLTGGCLYALQRIGQISAPASRRQRPHDFSTLIKPAPCKTQRMERYRHYRIAIGDQSIGGSIDPTGEQLGVGLLIAMLQADDQTARMFVIEARSSGPSETVGMCRASSAAHRFSGNSKLERQATAITHRIFQKGDPGKNRSAEAAARPFYAIQTVWRQDDVQQRPRAIAHRNAEWAFQSPPRAAI